MEYILIPVKDKEEPDFFQSLLRRMHKDVSTVTKEEMEDMAFVAAIKEGEQSGKGRLAKVKAHLSKVASEAFYL